MNKRLLLILIGVSATLAIIAQHQQEAVFMALKPLTTILIIILAWRVGSEQPREHVNIMLVALVFCLLGDVFLLREDYFVFGLSAFLVAHLLFAWIFTRLATVPSWSLPSLLSMLALLAISIVYFRYLMPHLGELLIPVAAYILCIMFMCWQAIRVQLSWRNPGSMAVAIGALLFVFSDSIIALNKFLMPFELSGLVILSSYWAAITLLAFNVTSIKR
ncbi:MAG: lysoplasmalogenase [Pseudomonadota bacterium]